MACEGISSVVEPTDEPSESYLVCVIFIGRAFLRKWRSEWIRRCNQPYLPLVALGPMPSSSAASVEELKKLKGESSKVHVPLTDAEACTLVKIFGPDDCFAPSAVGRLEGLDVGRAAVAASDRRLSNLHRLAASSH
jgi:hypothetical protein